MRVAVAVCHPTPDRPEVFLEKEMDELVSMCWKSVRVSGKRVVGCRLEGGQL